NPNYHELLAEARRLIRGVLGREQRTRGLASACDSRASIVKSAWSATRSGRRTRSGPRPYSFLPRRHGARWGSRAARLAQLARRVDRALLPPPPATSAVEHATP